ncbi:MAG: hypothetical protein V7607_2530 [Solirubrobacteraceae bacterium]
MPDDPTLTAAAIWFQTANDDRDPDTGIDVSIQDEMGAEIATDSIPYGGFPDGYTTRLFPLSVTQDATDSEVSQGQLVITINPNGNDRWIFDAHVRMRFSDRSHKVGAASGITLDQDHRSTQIALADVL